MRGGLSFSAVFMSACSVGMVCDLRVNEVGGRADGEADLAGEASAVRVIGGRKAIVCWSSGLTGPVVWERRCYESCS